MYLALIILAIVISVLLTLVVLIQNSKGGGLSSEFSGPSSTQMFGVKKTTDLLEQITWGLMSGVILVAFASYIVLAGGGQSGSGVNSVNIDRAQTQPSSNPTPTFPTDSGNNAAAPAVTPAPSESKPKAEQPVTTPAPKN